jgi:hypothetical protein
MEKFLFAMKKGLALKYDENLYRLKDVDIVFKEQYGDTRPSYSPQPS